MTPEEKLDKVVDRDSFIAFVDALWAEREETERLEREQPDSISTLLDAALADFEPGPHHRPEDSPSWRMFAEFLYFGKIYE